MIDFMMMCERWGEPDEKVWETAEMAYGRAVRAALEDAAMKQLRADPPWLAECFSRLRVEANAQATIRARLFGR